MYRIRIRRGLRELRKTPLPDKLSVSLDNQGFIDIAFNPKKPPHVFFDTNVLLSMGTADIEALKRLQAVRGFRYRYSMLNFTELASHLCDAPSKKYKSPFRRYQVAFQRLTEHFDSVLPSAESVFMQAAGLKHYLDPVWIVDPADITRQVRLISAAQSVEGLLRYNINPMHYKKLREVDGDSFVSMMKPVTTFSTVRGEGDEWGTWLGRFYSFMIFRASNKRTSFGKIKNKEQRRVIKFFDEAGGGMFRHHLLRLVDRAVGENRKEHANDFYDMLQLMLLKDDNLLFVTSDGAFFDYYAGPSLHRVVRWSVFKASAYT